jgi:membrane protease YdiL (CAAX protease family)
MTETAIFVVLLFGITWPWQVLVTPEAMSQGQVTFLAAFLPIVWAPTFIALVLTRYTKRAGAITRELRARLKLSGGSGKLIVIAGVTPLVVGALAMGVARAAGDGTSFIPSSALLNSIFIQVISGSTGEELGWRGFVLPRLRTRLGSNGAALMMGLIWASWHLPAFYTPGMPHRFMPMWPMLATIALFGVFLAGLFYRAGDSVLPGMAAHVSLNVILAVGGVNLASVAFWTTMAVLTFVIAVAAMIRSGESRADLEGQTVDA